MGKIGQQLIVRGVLLFLILLLINGIYQRFFLEKDIQKHSEIINLVRAVPNDAGMVYLG